MIANIFVCDRSFAFNGTDTINDLCKKILGMRALFSAIEERRSENVLYLQHENFMDTIISKDGDTVGKLIFGTEDEQFQMKQKYSRDVYNLMLSIFKNTQRSVFSHQEMLEYLTDDFEEKDACYGIVAMNHLEDLPESKQVLYDEKGFLKFRRYYIGKLINDSEEFIDQIESYYENLILNSNREFFKKKLNEVVESHGVCIINCLTALSEKFKDEISGKGEIDEVNLSKFLEHFAKSNNLDDGLFEGKNEKEELNCRFPKTREKGCLETINLYCGPHLKMYHDDKKKDDRHMRVYFAWDNENLDYIYVGMISSHVKR